MDGPTKIREWAAFLKQTREFLDARGYLEVTTNHLVPVGAFESTLDCLKVAWSRGEAELHTSPEIAMKRLLATNPQSIYQICRSFRDDPDTPIHKIEFSMLEFYRVGFSAKELLSETFAFFGHLCGPTPLHAETHSISELLKENTGIELSKMSNTHIFYQEAMRRGNQSVAQTDSWEDLFFKLVLDEVETVLPHRVPTALIDYPIAVSPLSKPGSDGQFAERFEIYWHGMEIANGCTELWSPTELQKRYEKESKTREAAGKTRHPFPKDLIEAAKQNVGPVAGVAIGMERLFLALEKHQILNSTKSSATE